MLIWDVETALLLDALRRANEIGSDIDMFNKSFISTDIMLEFGNVIR